MERTQTEVVVVGAGTELEKVKARGGGLIDVLGYQPDEVVVDLVRRVVGDLSGCRIGVLGLAFKPDVDDLRESPAIEICHVLAGEGTQVVAMSHTSPNRRA